MTDLDRPPNVASLAAQLDTTMEFFWERLEGLTDEEYFWEPAPGAWSLRARGRETTKRAFGKGDLVFEYESPEPQPAPLRTIAWLFWHMAEMCLVRADYTIGGRSLTLDDVECAPTAAEGIAQMRAAVQRWRAVFDEVPADEFAVVGRSAYPWGLDPQLPLADILWWMNRELIHHTAEVALLRDLYVHRAGTGAG
jgi:DinB superfamily